MQKVAKKAIKDARLPRTQKPEVEIWRKPHKRTCSTRLPIRLKYNIWIDLSATVWPLKTTSDLRKTGNSVDERRLTSNATLEVERRDI